MARVHLLVFACSLAPLTRHPSQIHTPAFFQSILEGDWALVHSTSSPTKTIKSLTLPTIIETVSFGDSSGDHSGDHHATLLTTVTYKESPSSSGKLTISSPFTILPTSTLILSRPTHQLRPAGKLPANPSSLALNLQHALPTHIWDGDTYKVRTTYVDEKVRVAQYQKGGKVAWCVWMRVVR